MVSERQIAANQRNAQKSTGARSASGRRRSSKNAYRHGLSVPLSTVEFGAQFNELVRQFAGGSEDAEVFVQAERAAHAQLELLRFRIVQTAMIERALKQFGPISGGTDERLGSGKFRQAIAQIEWLQKQGMDLPYPRLISPRKPGSESEKEVEAFRQILPELSRIHRYAKRAAGQRDRAICKIIKLHGKDKSRPAVNRDLHQETLAKSRRPTEKVSTCSHSGRQVR